MKCFLCDREATWSYAPGSEDLDMCDEHVPRECSFCNRDDDENELPKPWQPCVEWWPIVKTI